MEGADSKSASQGRHYAQSGLCAAADLDRDVVLGVRDSERVCQARAALVPLAFGGARQRQRLLPLRQDNRAAAPTAWAANRAPDQRRHGTAAHSTRMTLGNVALRMLEMCAKGNFHATLVLH